jgi:hypothetical protein
MLPTSTIPVGNTYRQTPVMNVRTPEQRATVLAIVASDDFDFAGLNPFDDPHGELKGYTGPFVFVWYDKAGRLHSVRIGKRGNVLSRYDA